jgi:hypothetical protein
MVLRHLLERRRCIFQPEFGDGLLQVMMDHHRCIITCNGKFCIGRQVFLVLKDRDNADRFTGKEILKWQSTLYFCTTKFPGGKIPAFLT